MIPKNLAVVTGRRWSSEMDSDYCYPIKEQMLQYLTQKIKEGQKGFGSGGAIGADLLYFFCVESLKKEYKNIQNYLFIPFREQSLKYNEYYTYWYNKALELADGIITVDEIMGIKPYGKYVLVKYQERNEFMLSCARSLLAIWDRKNTGGTYHTVTTARERRIPLEIIEC